jgi:hypothetical protein
MDHGQLPEAGNFIAVGLQFRIFHLDGTSLGAVTGG